MNILGSSESLEMDQDIWKRLMQVLELVNCLRDPQSGNCVPKEAFSPSYEDETCLCPCWIKKVVKAFFFLNIYSAFNQLWHEKVTVIRLEEALEQLSKLRLEVSIADVEHLAVFCPKVVSFVDDMDIATTLDTLIIFRSYSVKIHKVKAECFTDSQRRQVKTKVAKAMKKRELSFTKALCKIFKSLVQQHDKRPRCFSLENLLDFVKKGNSTAHVNETRKARKTISGAPGSHNYETQCRETSSLSPAEMIEHLRRGFGSLGQIVHVEEISVRAANYVDMPSELSEAAKSAINSIGITRLYSHQAESVKASLAGKNVVVSTMTSSGKSICYNIPVIEVLSQNPLACAIYLFPTKALAQDQLRALLAMKEGYDASLNIGIYDGDTSQSDRLWLRDNARLELAGLSTVELIKNDGSPSGLKHFVLWNPPLSLKPVSRKSSNGTKSIDTNDKKVIYKRSSSILKVSRLFAEVIQHGLHCIAFCKTRKLCELVLYYTREILQETALHLVDSICAYRGGYIAEDRRKIEKEFFSGGLRGVTATNALELGINVGNIDVTLHLGFPGSIASLWQQAGRSGRREKPSLSVYIAFEGPLDQHFMKFPQKLFTGPIECCHIDSQNRQVLKQHLNCAAIEHPLSLLHDEKYFDLGLKNSISTLKNKGYLTTDSSHDISAQVWSYIGYEKKPSYAVSIRAIETVKYQVIHVQNNEVLEEIEESRAFFQAYPARMSNLKLSRTTAQAHTCNVTTTWFGFHRIWKANNMIFDTVDLVLPKYSYESQAVWIRVPQSIKADVEINKFSFRAGLHAAGHAILNVVPLMRKFLMIRAMFLREFCCMTHPGGSGISAQVQPIFTELLTAALELLTSCRCSGDTGCPNCSQSLFCHEYNEVLHKEAAILIIKGLLDAEKAFSGKTPPNEPLV